MPSIALHIALCCKASLLVSFAQTAGQHDDCLVHVMDEQLGVEGLISWPARRSLCPLHMRHECSFMQPCVQPPPGAKLLKLHLALAACLELLDGRGLQQAKDTSPFLADHIERKMMCIQEKVGHMAAVCPARHAYESVASWLLTAPAGLAWLEHYQLQRSSFLKASGVDTILCSMISPQVFHSTRPSQQAHVGPGGVRTWVIGC